MVLSMQLILIAVMCNPDPALTPDLTPEPEPAMTLTLPLMKHPAGTSRPRRHACWSRA